MPAQITEITDATFATEVETSSKPVLVDFWAPWCGPCRVMTPVIEELATEHGDKMKFVKLNVDENQATAASHEILSIPTFILFEKGAQVHRIVGAVPKEKLLAELDKWL